MLATTPPVVSVPDAILTEFYEEYKGNIGRLDRAIQLVEAGHVERTNFPGLWLVRSGNPALPDAAYRVANGCCNCPDTARVGAQNCKHAVSVRIFRAMERLEADLDQSSDRYELTGRGYLTLIHSAALPPVVGTIRRVPVGLSARAAQAASELYGDDYSGDVA